MTSQYLKFVIEYVTASKTFDKHPLRHKILVCSNIADYDGVLLVLVLLMTQAIRTPNPLKSVKSL